MAISARKAGTIDELALREVDGLRGLPQQREADRHQRIDRRRSPGPRSGVGGSRSLRCSAAKARAIPASAGRQRRSAARDRYCGLTVGVKPPSTPPSRGDHEADAGRGSPSHLFSFGNVSVMTCLPSMTSPRKRDAVDLAFVVPGRLDQDAGHVLSGVMVMPCSGRGDRLAVELAEPWSAARLDHVGARCSPSRRYGRAWTCSLRLVLVPELLDGRHRRRPPVRPTWPFTPLAASPASSITFWPSSVVSPISGLFRPCFLRLAQEARALLLVQDRRRSRRRWRPWL